MQEKTNLIDIRIYVFVKYVMPDARFCRTYDRADFLQLMGTLAYAIPPQHFTGRETPPVISIYGLHASGKSLAAEALIKAWADEFSNDHLLSIPRDDKMFLEKKPMDAVNTVWHTSTAGGQPVTFAFNSHPLPHWGGYDETLADIFTNKTKPNLLIMSNVDRALYYNVPNSPVRMEINMNASHMKGGMFHRDIAVTVFDDDLLKSPHFTAYWDRMEELFALDRERERSLLYPKIQVRPLPGQNPT